MTRVVLVALAARGLTAVDVVNALNAQNLILPTGTAKLGSQEVNVALNGSPATLAGLGDIPITSVNGATVYVRDVAQVRDGYQPQTNVVRRDGERGLLMTVLKNGGASTLDIIDTIRRELPRMLLALPTDITVTPLSDQSVFVDAAIKSVVHEALIAAALTAALLLLFLGNWRSTAIIAVSIPLSILSSIIGLHLIGQSINIMTLGGLALAVGILVDDATVEIENVERHLHMGKSPHQAILDGAAEIATPALVATLCICIAFVPMFFLTGVAGKLFVPLAEAVVLAMLASYVLSRTLVPTLVLYLMQHRARHSGAPSASGRFRRIHLAFEAWFERFRQGYVVVLAALASLVAIVMELGVAKDLHGWNRSAHIALACLTIVTSWAFTHVMFALHYAHEYYRVLGEGDPAPLDFPGGTAPTYVDFLYMSMVIGTSGQTADVALASSGMRRIGLLHCTLAFAFNTTVLALMINIAAGLI